VIQLKKLLLAIGFFLLPVASVYAKNDSSSNQAASQQYRVYMSPSPLGSEVKNQNEIQTQNQGEDKEVRTQNQEEEESATEAGEGLQNRNENASEHMSLVAKKVQELLALKTQGGIGEQIREVAQEQNQDQTRIQEQLNKFESRGKFLKFMIGTDFEAVANLEQLMEQNRLRIQELTQLKDSLVSQGDITVVEETIQALTDQNTALQELIKLEEKTFSLFGWLAKLFSK
jgi:hypothetical protein